ncbi:MAG: nucleotidyl transferase AbiEii/AbiGii toxin family protein [Elusimicrobia bacterium]|nr:nucleotidyl transferase AbiEii/AbiGii toxin family protein [Elusimicrobiota bacterium]
MRPSTPNLDMLAVVAKGLRGLEESVAFVGGAVIDLYLSDPGAPQARPTADVDCVVELASRTRYHDIEAELRRLGFKHSTETGSPLCRWEYRGVLVDVMPPHQRILGFANRWYPDGLAHAENAILPDGQQIRVFSAPHLLASKLEAFRHRGKGDYLASRDIEDIVALLDGCREFAERFQRAPAELRSYLAEQFRTLLGQEGFVESVPGHVRDVGHSQVRAQRVLALLEKLSQEPQGR